jgi:hypothetical protein
MIKFRKTFDLSVTNVEIDNYIQSILKGPKDEVFQDMNNSHTQNFDAKQSQKENESGLISKSSPENRK